VRFVCAKAKRQQQVLDCAKAKRQQQQQDVGHEGVITGLDGFSLRSSIANPPRSRPVSTPINYNVLINVILINLFTTK